jgi:hypothetical protein
MMSSPPRALSMGADRDGADRLRSFGEGRSRARGANTLLAEGCRPEAKFVTPVPTVHDDKCVQDSPA